MLRAGDLDRRIVIERQMRGPASEYGEPSITWATRTRTWAQVRTLTGREFLAGPEMVSQARATFTIRWRGDVEATDRVRYGERIFNIMSMREIGRQEGLELMAEETK